MAARGARRHRRRPPAAAVLPRSPLLHCLPTNCCSHRSRRKPLLQTKIRRSNRSPGNVKAFAKDKRAHPPAASKAKEAQDAALAPTDDLAGQAKEAKADTMDAQQAGSFDKKAFIAAVKAAIEAKSPKTLKEADNYAKSGKAGEVKGEVKGLVTQGKEGQAKDIETATAAPPDTSKAVPKPVTPMGPEQQSGGRTDSRRGCRTETGATRTAQP